jgi:hypothetical protein
MKRVYHPYNEWEEYHAGMWRDVSKTEEERFLKEAIEFTGDYKLYGSWMLKVVDEWPKSCEHNLSSTGMNRQAWIGHAACCLAIGCPEHITRHAWHVLTQDQQDKANLKADEAIALWESRYNEKVLKHRCFYRNTIQSKLGV